MLNTVDSSKPIEYMSPPEKGFGFLYFSHMIPPYEPKDCLILGSGKGTVSALIRKIWQNTPITGIDKEEGFDAYAFVKDSNSDFDYIAIDLWNGQKVCSFIYDKSFIKEVRRLATAMISINIPISDREKAFSAYTENGFNYERHDVIEGNAVIFFS